MEVRYGGPTGQNHRARADGRAHAARSLVIILLSLRAGLRAAEIAKLEWHMVLDATGKVGRPSNWKTTSRRKNQGGASQFIPNSEAHWLPSSARDSPEGPYSNHEAPVT